MMTGEKFNEFGIVDIKGIASAITDDTNLHKAITVEDLAKEHITTLISKDGKPLDPEKDRQILEDIVEKQYKAAKLIIQNSSLSATEADRRKIHAGLNITMRSVLSMQESLTQENLTGYFSWYIKNMIDGLISSPARYDPLTDELYDYSFKSYPIHISGGQVYWQRGTKLFRLVLCPSEADGMISFIKPTVYEAQRVSEAFDSKCKYVSRKCTPEELAEFWVEAIKEGIMTEEEADLFFI